MNYMINEGQLLLPTDDFQDMTMNILNFESIGTSLVVSRAKIKAEDTLESSLNTQLEMLQKQMKDFKLLSKDKVEIGKKDKLRGIECKNQFSTPQHFICQYQFASEPKPGMMFVLTYAKYILQENVKKDSGLTSVEIAHWQKIKENFVFKPFD